MHKVCRLGGRQAILGICVGILAVNIKNARQGIRFIDPKYNELFRIPDGEKIVLTTSGGETEERSCRFIDEYHTDVGNQLYHICQSAELMARNEWSRETGFLMALCECLWYNQIVITGENLLIQSLRLDYIKSKDKNATCVAIHARAGR